MCLHLVLRILILAITWRSSLRTQKHRPHQCQRADGQQNVSKVSSMCQRTKDYTWYTRWETIYKTLNQICDSKE